MQITDNFTMYTIQQVGWYGTGFFVLPVTNAEEYEPNKMNLTLIDGNDITVDLTCQDLHETTGEELFYLAPDCFYENGWWRHNG